MLFLIFPSSTAPFGITTSSRSTRIAAGDNMPDLPSVDRGVSVDQDGKSNVWAIEPKMEVSSTSSDENGKTELIAAGGLAAFAVTAGLILTNLPDPNQF
jgi:hypothetical protein